MNEVLSDENAQRLAKVFAVNEGRVHHAWDTVTGPLSFEGSMEVASNILGGYGVESVSCAGKSMEYINSGDTYDLTICREGKDVFLSSWGDWYEEVEEKHCEEEGVVRCSNCGEFTPMDQSDWRDVVCESCGTRLGG